MTRRHTVSAAAAALALAVAGCGATTSATQSQQGGSQSTQTTQSTQTATPTTGTTAPATVTQHFVGTVLAANRAQHWFEIRSATGEKTRIHTDAKTVWTDCGWESLQADHRLHPDHQITVTARHTTAGWIANTIAEHGTPGRHDTHHTSTHD